MPTRSATIVVHAPPEVIFDLVHDYDRRLEWDPFLREARILGRVEEAARGVTTRCVARRAVGGLAMETVYVSFRRPVVAAVKMTRGPWFLRSFAASIRQDPVDEETTRVTYRYSFESRPRWLACAADPVFGAVFQHETRRRLAALKRFVANEQRGSSSRCHP